MREPISLNFLQRKHMHNFIDDLGEDTGLIVIAQNLVHKQPVWFATTNNPNETLTLMVDSFKERINAH